MSYQCVIASWKVWPQNTEGVVVSSDGRSVFCQLCSGSQGLTGKKSWTLLSERWGGKKPESCKLCLQWQHCCQRGNDPGSQQLARFSSCLRTSGGETLRCMLGVHQSCSAVRAPCREKAEGRELKFPVVVSINICTQTCFMLVRLISLLPSFKWSV